MKRRDFFKKGTKGVLAAGLFPIMGDISEQTSNSTNLLFKQEETLIESLKTDPIRRK